MNRQQFLFLKLMEECAEVQHRASKSMQFGADEVQKGQLESNSERLRFELNDLLAVVAIMEEELVILPESKIDLALHIREKRAKIAKYMAYSIELGYVDAK